jgi:hypothetical protein
MRISRFSGRLVFLAAIIVISLALISCGSSGGSTSTTSTTLAENDSTCVLQINLYRPSPVSGYLYELDCLVVSTQNVDNLVNPVAGKESSVISVETTFNITTIERFLGSYINADVKEINVPGTGNILVASNISVTSAQ